MDASVLGSTAKIVSTATPPVAGNPAFQRKTNVQTEAWPAQPFHPITLPLTTDKARDSTASLFKPHNDGTRQPRIVGHKRSATGEIKTAVDEDHRRSGSILDTQRGHTRTTSASSNGSKIAELTAQLRARLSYAAAKVEQTRQLQQDEESATTRGGAPSGAHSTISSLQDTAFLHNEPSKIAGVPPMASNINITIDQNVSNTRSLPHSVSQAPKLAPPVDIVSGDASKSSRRRPNPNVVDDWKVQAAKPRHRRDASGHDDRRYHTDISRFAESGNTTPLRAKTDIRTLTPQPSSQRPSIKQRTPSQNALMEKDAIETLLFMSSPDNSGYHSASRARNPSVSRSIDANLAASTHPSSQDSNNSASIRTGPGPNPYKNAAEKAGFLPVTGLHTVGLEARAGDDIDRLLDQMEVDRRSEAESYGFPYGFDTGATNQSEPYELEPLNR